MKAQLEETVDAAVEVGLLRDELMAEDALRRGEDYLRLTIDRCSADRSGPIRDTWNHGGQALSS